jgi:16S rRNA (adenine1518-N6/adenine1519-N6)-dimethyltransferase
VRICPRPEPLIGDQELAWLEQVVRAAFAQRRKTVANSLRGSGLLAGPPEPALERAGIDPRARAESLPPERLVALARALAHEHEPRKP